METISNLASPSVYLFSFQKISFHLPEAKDLSNCLIQPQVFRVRLVLSDCVFQCFPAGIYYTVSASHYQHTTPTWQVGLQSTCQIYQASWRVRTESGCELVSFEGSLAALKHCSMLLSGTGTYLLQDSFLHVTSAYTLGVFGGLTSWIKAISHR